MRGGTEIVTVLLAAGADVNISSIFYITALHKAVCIGVEDVVERRHSDHRVPKPDETSTHGFIVGTRRNRDQTADEWSTDRDPVA